jgi:hypothetical protein
MADSAQIAAVSLQIPDEAESLGFDTQAISDLLDSGLSQTKTILAVLNGMAAKSASIEDISESGSSRSSKFFDNLKALIDYWQSRADKEDIVAGNAVKENARVYTAVRV